LFNIGFAELILILLIAFLVVGPKDLPKVARALARFVRYLKGKWAEFVEEADLAETVDELKAMKTDIEQTVRSSIPMDDLKKTKADTEESLRQAKRIAEGKPSPSKDKRS